MGYRNNVLPILFAGPYQEESRVVRDNTFMVVT